MPLRYLCGPVVADFPTFALVPAREQGTCRLLGGPQADVNLHGVKSWEQVQSRLGDWQPDAWIFDLATAPDWLVEAPCPRIGLMRHWEVNWHVYQRLLPLCDAVVSDPAGVEALSRQNLPITVLSSSFNGCPRAFLHEPLPSRARDIDVLILGPLQAAVQRETLALLHRILPLSTHHRVVIDPTTDPKVARELLQRSRIVVQHSPWHGCHPFAFLALACGALLFQEAGNREVGQYLQDGQHYVAYQEHTLRTLLESYLDNEDHRQQITQAARLRIQDLTGEVLWERLIEQLEQNWTRIETAAAQRTPTVPSVSIRSLLAVAGSVPFDPALIQPVEVGQPNESFQRYTQGLLMGLSNAGSATDRGTQAAQAFAEILQHQPHHLMTGLNRAEALVQAGQSSQAVEQARKTLSQLEACQHSSTALDPNVLGLDDTHYPPSLDPFRVEWERIGWQFAGQAWRQHQEKLRLLRWRLHGILAQQQGSLTHRYEATLARPDLPATRAALGAALVRANLLDEAVNQFRLALNGNPFQPAAARALADVLHQQGRNDERTVLLEERRRWHTIAPQLVPLEDWFRQQAGVPTPRVAPRPKAAPGKRVSLCMIVKNEEKNLPRCLRSVHDLVDEIRITDTGSTDRTREVAREFGAQVVEFPWVNSFAAARTESMRHATMDWIYWMDADEHLDETNRSRLRQLLTNLPADDMVYMIGQRSLPDAVTGAVLLVEQARLFRRSAGLSWQYRVHEQILPNLLRRGARVCRTEIVVEHHGYQDPALKGRKLDRNYRLLQLQLKDHPADSFTLFNLGGLMLDRGQTTEALEHFQQSLKQSPPKSSLLPKLYCLVAHCQRLLARREEALATCQQGRQRLGEDAELLFQEGMLWREQRDLTQAEGCLTRLLELPRGSSMACVDEGVHGYKARHHLALVYRDQGRPAAAERQWRETLVERPDFLPAWLGLAELCLAQQRAAEFDPMVAKLESNPETVWVGLVLRGWWQLRHKDYAPARTSLQSAISKQPWALWPKILLAEVSLADGTDAAITSELLRQVLALDPHHGWARNQLARLATRTTTEHTGAGG